MNKKLIALLLTLVLLVGVVAGGTIAWLTAKTAPVTNTFTVGDINIELTETDAAETDGKLEKAYHYVPGDTLAKDPKVTVTADSETCYLFVHVDEMNNGLPGAADEKVVNYTVDTTVWTQVPNETEYWYRVVNKTDSPKEFYVLTNNQVTINTGVTKPMVETLNASEPQIIVTAAAVQKDNLPGADDAAKLAYAFEQVKENF